MIAGKSKSSGGYTTTDKEVKKSIRKDKREDIDKLAKQAEKVAGQGNSPKSSQTSFNRQISQLKTKMGTLLRQLMNI